VKAVRVLLYSLLGLMTIVLVAARIGLLAGQQPTDLGVKNGRLKPPSITPNSVSSQASLHSDHVQRGYASIDSLPLKSDDPVASLRELSVVLKRMTGVSVIEQKSDYLYAQAQTRWLKVVDDVEFWFNPERGVIEVRSASRVGRLDFGVNRQRVEAVRTAYLAQP
jgi:uncharacterized protein (DUF1499 family)